MSLNPSHPDRLRIARDERGRSVAISDEPVCDFCLAPGPRWEFPAAPMEIKGHHTVDYSEDEFAACDTCRRLIEAHNVGGMVERMVFEQRRQMEGSDALFKPVALQRRDAREVLLRFFDARMGPPRPWSG